MNSSLDILVVGAGMYVTGRHTAGYGTILPALFLAVKKGLVRRIIVASTSPASAEAGRIKAGELMSLTGISPEIVFYPRDASSRKEPFLQAIEDFPSIGAAIVAVPDQFHFEIAKTLIDLAIHLMVVKPLVPSVVEHRALIELAREREVLGLVEFHKRFDEANLALYRALRKGSLGEILNIQVNFRQRRTIPLKVFRSWVEATDIFQYLGVHYVDLIFWLTGARPRRVMSCGQKKLLIKHGVDSYDTILTAIEWVAPEGSSFLSTHLSSWVDPDTTSAMSDQGIEILGTEGCWRSDQKDRGVTYVSSGQALEHINPYFSQFYPSIEGDFEEISGYGPRSVLQFLNDVLDVRAGKSRVRDLAGLRPTFSSTLTSTEAVEASRKSLVSGSIWVDVPSVTTREP